MFGWCGWGLSEGGGCWKKCLRLWAAVKGGLSNFRKVFQTKREGKNGWEGREKGCGQRRFNERERQREKALHQLVNHTLYSDSGMSFMAAATSNGG